jgi:hypothetical protein
VSFHYQRSSDWELQGATSGNVYREALAKEGFVVIAFDASFKGGGGIPRVVEDPTHRVEERCALQGNCCCRMSLLCGFWTPATRRLRRLN